MLLYIVRHGQPIYGPDTLTELGRKQAEALADRFAVHGLDRIFSSPMGRARETAQPTADRLGLPVKIEYWTREIWPELTLTMPDGSPHFCMDLYPDTYRSAENKTLGEDWHTMPCLNSIAGKQAWARVVRYSDNFFMRLGYKRETDGVYRIVKPMTSAWRCSAMQVFRLHGCRTCCAFRRICSGLRLISPTPA